MNDTAWKYSAYLKLYGKEGMQVNFTVNGSDLDQFTAELGDLVDMMLSDEQGFSITPESIKPGEKLQEVDSWLLGETSEGQSCIHLYKMPLQWKVATIYEERMKDVPIDIKGKKAWPGTAPEREVAEKKGYLNSCNFTIVLTPTGKMTDSGKPVMKFDRTVGYGATAPAPAARQQSSKKASDVQAYADLYGMLSDEPKKLADWCRKAAGDPKNKNLAGEERVAILCEEIDNITGTEASAEAVLEVLTGIPTTELRDQMKSYVVNGLIKWISPYLQQGKQTVDNADRKPAIVEAVKFIWGMANGYNEVNQQAAGHKKDENFYKPETGAAGPATDEDIPF